MNMHTGHQWLPEHKDLLRGLWNDNVFSCSEIMETINEAFGLNLTRSAIIGRAHRMGLRKKDSPIIRSHDMDFDRHKFIQMYNGGISNSEMMKEFGLHTAEQIRYRARKLGLKSRTATRSTYVYKRQIPPEYIPAMLDPDVPGIPMQLHERINNFSKSWFRHTEKCSAVPCEHLAVPTGMLCYFHGEMMCS